MSEDKPRLTIKDGKVWRVYPDGSMRRVVKGISQHYSSALARKAQRERDA